MGGLLILIAATVAFLPLSDYTLPALTVFGTTLACGGVGFLDDYLKLHHKRSLGLRGRWKILMLAGITVAVSFAAQHQHLSHSSSSRSSTMRCRSGRSGTCCSS